MERIRLNELFQEAFKFSKAEILLMDPRQPNEFTGDVFAPSQSEASGRVMNVFDEINAKWGARYIADCLRPCIT